MMPLRCTALSAKSVSLGGKSFSWIRFTSLAHLPLNQVSREGIAQMVYYVQEDEASGYILKRSDNLYPYPEFEESDDDPVVCEQLQEFKLIFFDEAGRELESWDSEDDDTEYGTPRAVGIRLSVGETDAPFLFRTQVMLPVYRYQPVKR
jgi:general secretion pathway protein J